MRDVARERQLSLVETARVFALVNVLVHDGLRPRNQQVRYSLWRPVTAIQQGASAGNGKTDGDAGFATFLTTPPLSVVCRQLATIGARRPAPCARRSRHHVHATCRHVGPSGPRRPRRTRRWQVAEQQAESRIYGGIHYRFDNLAGQQIGKSAAEFVFANYMTRRDRWDD